VRETAKEKVTAPKEAAPRAPAPRPKRPAAAAAPAPAAPRAATPKSEPAAPRDIGIDVPRPAQPCTDQHCPFHGKLNVRGQALEGVIVTTRMQRTVVVEREYSRYIQKFERYETRTRRMLAHAPPCLTLAPGHRVTLMECRPLSKTVSFVVIHNRGVRA